MEAEEKIETESMSIKQERELNTKIKGWRVGAAVRCGVTEENVYVWQEKEAGGDKNI